MEMEASTTIRKMMAAGKIVVPDYQRAYEWDTPNERPGRNTHTDVFLKDLEAHSESQTKSCYYFGHFLFEEKPDAFRVIDGQQRLTTIVIFLAVLFVRLRELRPLQEEEENHYEEMIKRRSTHRFHTVPYDNRVFIDYVIERTKTDKHGLETQSSRRIVEACDFFRRKLADKSEDYLTRMLAIISSAACTTHLVHDEAQAIQIFIFQNNRGKKPTDLEIVKARFMYNVHLHGGDEKDALIDEIRDRFVTIYRSISAIEHRINEDEILLYTARVHFNSLVQPDALGIVDRTLAKGNPITFIKAFTHALTASFEHLKTFFRDDEKTSFAVHSLVTLGDIGIALPFIIKAYRFGLPTIEVEGLCVALENVLLRHRLIGTRADVAARLNDVFKGFTETNPYTQPILARIAWMKSTTDGWGGYWNNREVENALQGYLYPPTARFLLWKYETYLEQQGKAGYKPTRFDKITDPEMEHVAPQTEPDAKPHGYGEYDEEFKNKYLHCLGNYLLLSKSHNCSVGNVPFADKHKTYWHNEQQREIQRLAQAGQWDKEQIRSRKEKIVSCILETC